MAKSTSRKADKKTHRLSMVLSEKSKKRVDRVIELMEAETTTDAVLGSLRVLEYFLDINEKGGKIFVQLPEDEQPKQLELFL